MKVYKLTASIFFILICTALFLPYFSLGERSEPLLMTETINTIRQIDNIVMSVYLDYRLFDTVFEAMLLIICVMGVLQFSSFNSAENKFLAHRRQKSHNFSSLMTDGLNVLYPFIMLFGVYIILSGLDSPGGGFQGGAVIAAIVMSFHLSTKKNLISLKRAETVEKIMFMLFILLASLFLTMGNMPQFYRAYLVIFNIIIAVKVFCGFIVIYMQFMNNEVIEEVL